MDEPVATLAKVVMDIHRKRSHSGTERVPLFSLHTIHPINSNSALEATRKRVDILMKHKTELAEQRVLTKDQLVQYIPAVSAIKVVMEHDNSYIAFEGNCRLVALQTVFVPADNIHISKILSPSTLPLATSTTMSSAWVSDWKPIQHQHDARPCYQSTSRHKEKSWDNTLIQPQLIRYS